MVYFMDYSPVNCETQRLSYNVELFFLVTVQHAKHEAPIDGSKRLVDRIPRTFSIVSDPLYCVLGNENTIDRHIYGQRYHSSSERSR